MVDDKNNPKDQEVNESRRDFLKKSGYVAGGVIGGGILGSVLGVNFNEKDTSEPGKSGALQFNKALMYFKNQHEFKVLAVATERIYPEDENGPGAIELGVPYFIDHQLAGAYGYNTKEYMQAPFKKGAATQGYQTRLKRHEIFINGIRALDKESRKQFDDSFIDIDDDNQDKLLQQCEEDKLKMKAVQSSQFFSLLRSATLAGVYADPLYGGNIDMKGWKMKEYPGNQMSYLDEIESEEFVEMEPESLSEHIDL